ncbi:hypothetical protein TNCV_2830721 [Trichonephila clavipes]|nr:hypothetical protein TNCV_2830721 [Trichonephila clavipes]
MQLLPLPAYSPDISPIAPMWNLVCRHLARDPCPAVFKKRNFAAHTSNYSEWPRYLSGQGSGFGLERHELKPSTAGDSPCKGAIHFQSSMSRAQTSSLWYGVEVKRGKCQLRYHPLLLTMVQNYEVCHQKFPSS